MVISHSYVNVYQRVLWLKKGITVVPNAGYANMLKLVDRCDDHLLFLGVENSGNMWRKRKQAGTELISWKMESVCLKMGKTIYAKSQSHASFTNVIYFATLQAQWFVRIDIAMIFPFSPMKSPFVDG